MEKNYGGYTLLLGRSFYSPSKASADVSPRRERFYRTPETVAAAAVPSMTSAKSSNGGSTTTTTGGRVDTKRCGAPQRHITSSAHFVFRWTTAAAVNALSRYKEPARGGGGGGGGRGIAAARGRDNRTICRLRPYPNGPTAKLTATHGPTLRLAVLQVRNRWVRTDFAECWEEKNILLKNKMYFFSVK